MPTFGALFLGHRPSGGYSARVLHLRVIAPEDLRDDVIGVLQQEVGVANVLLYPGAALDPPGDEIAADIARECANDVIKHLKALEVHHRGSISLEVLDTVLSSKAHEALQQGPRGSPARPTRRETTR